jgi:hypothetical protein
MNKLSYKFNPLKFGYVSLEEFPILHYRYGSDFSTQFIKIVEYNNRSGILVFWYSHIQFLGHDDRVCISGSSIDVSNISDRYTSHQEYLGTITSDNYANELLKHLLGTGRNANVETHGLNRLLDREKNDIIKELLNAIIM